MGSKHSPADHAPEFHAKTLPPGSAPANRTFQPNPESEVPGQADNANLDRSHGKESTQTTATSTLTGADSGSVHTGLGHPGQGQTSSELRNDGKHTSKREGAGLEGIGARVGDAEGKGEIDQVSRPANRGVARDEAASGQRGTEALVAEERIPESADSVASGRA